MKNWKDLIRLLRPHQWVKSGFVFTGYFFVEGWRVPGLTLGVVLAAVAFSLVASGVYVLNDIADRQSDRNHPKKWQRPVARGAVSVTAAIALMVLVVGTGFFIGDWVAFPVLVLLLLYFLISILYSYWLKHVVILDVFVIAAGFILRILVGTSGVGIAPSKWLLLCGTMLALFLGFAKRHAELRGVSASQESRRAVLEHYSEPVLESMMTTTGGAALATYALYTVDSATVAFHHTEALIYTVPIVTYGLFRYLYLLHHHDIGEDTAREMFTDWHMIGTLAVWVLTVLIILHQANPA